MGRVSDDLLEKLAQDQTGFRPGISTCGQILNLTGYIADAYENNEIICSVFVDLTATYDTVNHRFHLLNMAKCTRNSKIVRKT